MTKKLLSPSKNYSRDKNRDVQLNEKSWQLHYASLLTEQQNYQHLKYLQKNPLNPFESYIVVYVYDHEQ